METSDSESFESADEEFHSDNECNQSVLSIKSKKLVEDIKVSEAENKFNKLQIKNESTKTINTVISENENNNQQECEKINKTSPEENDENKKEITKVIKCTKTETQLTDNNQTNKEIQQQQQQSESIISESITAKHDSQNTEKDSTNSQQKINEDNLWDDDELDWGRENQENITYEKVGTNNVNMWGNDNWETIEDEPREASQPAQNDHTNWSGWGNWDVSTILSTATQSVSTLTSQVSQVLETGMGIPDPEELAKITKQEHEKIEEKLRQTNDYSSRDKNTTNIGFGLSNLVSGVTKFVETTGTKVISGGLDTLETIGKKTMQVLQEGDPGLKKKRAFLKIDNNKPVLSQLLREAKEKAETENKLLEEKFLRKKWKNYETLFDDHKGLVHLEALEMLSKQCDIKLQTLLESYTDSALIEMQETMEQVKELCELPDEDEDEQINSLDIKNKLESAVKEINIPITYQKLVELWTNMELELNNLTLCDAKELHQQAIDTLAQLTAISVEQFHKTAELLLVKEHRSTADEADSLVQLTTTLTSLIGIVAAKFSDKLNTKVDNSTNKEDVNSLITNVFLEAANSSSYIQDAFQLLIPILQVGAI